MLFFIISSFFIFHFSSYIFYFRWGADGILGVCKLADIHHRLSRAVVHDNAQISQWSTFEQQRLLTSESNILKREQQYLLLKNNGNHSVNTKKNLILNGNVKEFTTETEVRNAEDDQSSSSLTVYGNPNTLVNSMSKLQREMTVRAQKLLAAEEKEDNARKVKITH